MASGLIDTNILIDLLRNYPRSQRWLKNNESLKLFVPSIVRMELVAGCHSKDELRDALRLIKPLELVLLNQLDAQWAMEQFEIFHLSHHIGLVDCFIAAISVRLERPIYTRNIKDYLVFRNVITVEPY